MFYLFKYKSGFFIEFLKCYLRANGGNIVHKELYFRRPRMRMFYVHHAPEIIQPFSYLGKRSLLFCISRLPRYIDCLLAQFEHMRLENGSTTLIDIKVS